MLEIKGRYQRLMWGHVKKVTVNTLKVITVNEGII